MEVDPYNYIWLQTYDYRVYRFDQSRNSNKSLLKVKRRVCVSLLLKYCPTVSFGYFLKMRGCPCKNKP